MERVDALLRGRDFLQGLNTSFDSLVLAICDTFEMLRKRNNANEVKWLQEDSERFFNLLQAVKERTVDLHSLFDDDAIGDHLGDLRDSSGDFSNARSVAQKIMNGCAGLLLKFAGNRAMGNYQYWIDTVTAVGELSDSLDEALERIESQSKIADALVQRVRESARATKQGRAEGGETPLAEDGPAPPNYFWHQKNRHEVPRPKVWLLIKALWISPNRTAHTDALKEPVWGDREFLLDTNAIGSVRRDANQFFTSNNLPFLVKTKNNYCTLASIAAK